MSRHTKRPRRASRAKTSTPAGDGADERAGRFDLYQTVTDRIVELLEAGTAPWRSPVMGSEIGQPISLTTGKPYRGVNVFLLAMSAMAGGYRSRYWMTYKQAAERGGQVRKGERSTLAVFWKLYETEDRKTGEEKKVPLLRYYNVFNADQTDGVTVPDEHAKTDRVHRPLMECERIIAGFAPHHGGPAFAEGGTVPAYVPALDAVRVPPAGRFVSDELYYTVVFHELGHATGAPRRLARWADADGFARWGTDGYRKEELIAEMTAAFLCGEAGIGPATIEDSASYLAGWVQALRGDKRLIVTAAAQAQRASDLILGRTFGEQQEEQDERTEPAGRINPDAGPLQRAA